MRSRFSLVLSLTFLISATAYSQKVNVDYNKALVPQRTKGVWAVRNHRRTKHWE